MADDLIDFQSALQQLQMTEAELSNLVARGDLRVIRSGGKPMFRPSDIDGLKQERETEPTIIIPASGGAAPAPAESGPITIDLPSDLGVDESAATVVPDSGDTGTEEIVFDESDLEILPLDEEASQTSALTAAAAPAVRDDEMTVVDDDASATQVQDEDDDGVEVAEEIGVRESRRGGGRPSIAASRRLSAAYDVKPGHPAMTALVIVTAAILLFMGSVLTVILWKGYEIKYEVTVQKTAPGSDKIIDVKIEKKERFVPGYLEGTYQSFKDAGEGGVSSEEDFGDEDEE